MTNKTMFLPSEPHQTFEYDLKRSLKVFQSYSTPKDRDYFRNAKYDELIMFHHSFGGRIRNELKLWERSWVPNLVDGIDESDEHPDNYSFKIIQEVWRKLNEQSSPNHGI